VLSNFIIFGLSWTSIEVTRGSIDADVAVQMLMWHCTDDYVGIYGH
jgi:hypothetical protein